MKTHTTTQWVARRREYALERKGELFGCSANETLDHWEFQRPRVEVDGTGPRQKPGATSRWLHQLPVALLLILLLLLLLEASVFDERRSVQVQYSHCILSPIEA